MVNRNVSYHNGSGKGLFEVCLRHRLYERIRRVVKIGICVCQCT